MEVIKGKQKKARTILITFIFLALNLINLFSSTDLYILDTGNNRLQKFDLDGNFLMLWGEKGNGNGQFYYPAGLAVSSDNNYVYVADTSNNRIQKFNVNGNFIKIIGSNMLVNPNSISVNFESGKDFIYVADTGNNRILKFDEDGNFIMVLGKGNAGNQDGEFNNPQGICVFNNFVFVSDTGNNRVQKLDLQGNFILKWGGYGNEAGKFNCPRDICVDSEGYVYVVDSQNYRVEKFTQQGEFILQWGSQGKLEGQFNGHFGISADEENFIYVADAGNNRVQKFDKNGNLIKIIGGINRGTKPGEFYYPQGVEIGYLKVIFTPTETPTFSQTITDTFTLTFTPTFTNTETFTFTETFTPTETFTNTATQTQEMIPTEIETPVQNNCELEKISSFKVNVIYPIDAEIDNEGNYYFTDLINNCIVKLNNNGEMIKRIGYKQFLPISTAINDGFIYAIDIYGKVIIYDKEGNLKKVFFTKNNGDFLTNKKIIVINEFLYIFENFNKKIQKYDKDGNLIQEIKINAGDEIISDITIDKNINIYLANAYKGEIKIYDASGRFIKKIKTDETKLLFSQKIIVDNYGNIYILDNYKRKLLRIMNETIIEVIYLPENNIGRYLLINNNNEVYVIAKRAGEINIYQIRCKSKNNNANLNALNLPDKEKIIINEPAGLDEKTTYNYPNPFNNSTTIRFNLLNKTNVKILIYDINGKIVWQKEISNYETKIGLNEIIYDGKNENGLKISNGVYFYKIITDEKTITKKLVIMK